MKKILLFILLLFVPLIYANADAPFIDEKTTTYNDNFSFKRNYLESKIKNKYDVSDVVFFNLSTKSSIEANDVYTQEFIKKDSLLENNAVTSDGFKIGDFASGCKVTVQKNDLAPRPAYPNESFTEDGKYTVKVTTSEGSKSTTIYVFSGGDDKGFSTYFKDIFASDSAITLCETDSYMPPLYGTIFNESGEAVYTLYGSREKQIIELTSGKYTAKFNNCGVYSTGSYYSYSFDFKIGEEKSLIVTANGKKPIYFMQSESSALGSKSNDTGVVARRRVRTLAPSANAVIIALVAVLYEIIVAIIGFVKIKRKYDGKKEALQIMQRLYWTYFIKKQSKKSDIEKTKGM